MKKLFSLAILLIVLFGACDKSVDPADPLYRTWRQTQTEYRDGRIVDYAITEFIIVTFQSNGLILYGADGRYAACCYPHRFKRKGNTLDFINVKSIPTPSVDNAEKCHLVDCLLQGNSWQILTLTDKRLILETPFGNHAYQPYP